MAHSYIHIGPEGQRYKINISGPSAENKKVVAYVYHDGHWMVAGGKGKAARKYGYFITSEGEYFLTTNKENFKV